MNIAENVPGIGIALVRIDNRGTNLIGVAKPAFLQQASRLIQFSVDAAHCELWDKASIGLEGTTNLRLSDCIYWIYLCKRRFLHGCNGSLRYDISGCHSGRWKDIITKLRRSLWGNSPNNPSPIRRGVIRGPNLAKEIAKFEITATVVAIEG